MSLKLWIPLNGDTNDISGEKSVIYNIGATIDNSGKIGKCYSFDGLSNHMYVPCRDFLKYRGGDMTLSLWVYINSTDTTSGFIISKPWNGSGNYNYRISFSSVNNTIGIYMTGNSIWSETSSVVNIKDRWAHIAVVLSSDNKVKLFLDGVILNEWTHDIISWDTISGGDGNLNLSIATLYPYGSGWAGNTSYSLQCKMNDVRIYNHALSDKEIIEISKGKVLHYSFNIDTDKVYDISGFHNSIDLGDSNIPLWHNDSNLGRGCYKFNAVNTIIPVAIDSLRAMVFNSITVSARFRVPNGGIQSTDWGSYIVHNSPDTSIGNSHYTLGVMAAGKVVWAWNGAWSGMESPLNYNDGLWHTATGVWDGTHSILYIDGVEVVRLSNVSNKVFNNTKVAIGGSGSGVNYRVFNGDIDDVKIYATALDSSSILDLYRVKGSLDDKGNMFANNIDIEPNIAYKVNEAIIEKTYTNGLGYYTQPNCQVTLTDKGFRIYRPSNLVYPGAGNTMWGGLKINLFNIDPNILQKGHKYKISFKVTGQSSNGVGRMYFSNMMGWGGINGLTSVSAYEHTSLEVNFKGTKEIYALFDITDDIWKVCTTSYSTFEAGTYYNCYKDLCWGFIYESTGPLGTDLYITDFVVKDITDNRSFKVTGKGILKSLNVSEIGIADGLMGWWKLDENVKDSCGKYHGTNYGAVISQGLRGNAYSFNGVSSYISTGILPTTSQLFISLWFKPNAIIDGERLYWGKGTNRAILALTSGNKFQWYIATDVGNTGYKISNTTFDPLSWNNVCLAYDGTVVELYVNGIKDSVNASLVGNSISSAFNLGTNYSNAGNWYDGKLWDMRVYDRVLSIEEVGILYKWGLKSVNLQQSRDIAYIKNKLIEVM